MVFVYGLVDRVLLVGPRAEAAGVHFADVDLGLAVDHPLGEVLPGARSLGDADGGAGAHPVVACTGDGAHEVTAVGGVGDGAADHLFDTCFGEHREAFGGDLQPRGELLEVGWGQVEVKVPVDAVNAVGDGVAGLVRADEQAVDLAAVVARRAGVSDDGHLNVACLHGVKRFGYEVLVDHRDNGDVDAGHGAQLGGVMAGRVDDVVAGDLLLFAGVPVSNLGRDLPAAVWQLGDVRDERVAGDLGAELAGADGHGVGGPGGVGPAIVGGVESQDHVVDGLHEGGHGADFVVTDEV